MIRIPSQRPAPDAEMHPCPFCDIIAGQGPAKKLRTWKNVISIVPVGPVVEGHALVIPHRHFARPEHNRGASEDALDHAIEWASSRGEDYHLILNVGKDAGQTVPHLHWHYVPRRQGDRVTMPWAHPAER